jgi:hypothetical protein
MGALDGWLSGSDASAEQQSWAQWRAEVSHCNGQCSHSLSEAMGTANVDNEEREIFMISNFEQVHNYYERLVFEEVVRMAPQHPDFSSDMLADAACVALNWLPARYVRHDVDLMFYLTEDERHKIDQSLDKALEFAFSYVGKRAVKRAA